MSHSHENLLNSLYYDLVSAAFCAYVHIPQADMLSALTFQVRSLDRVPA